MKAITGKMLISLVGVMVAAPFFLIALVAGARAIELAHNAHDEALLIVLAMCGAVISMINGFGRRTQKTQRKAEHVTAHAGLEAQTGKASAINLGY
jgi:hypothetical protein